MRNHIFTVCKVCNSVKEGDLMYCTICGSADVYASSNLGGCYDEL